MPTNAETLIATFQSIANQVRSKGVTGTMTPEQISAKIDSLVPETICGVTIDSIFGNVSNGRIQQPQNFTFSSSTVTQIGENALKYTFMSRPNLTEVNLTNLTTIQNSGMSNAFEGCTSLTSVNLSNLTSVDQAGLESTFRGCTSLRTVRLNKLSSCGTNGLQNTFFNCSALEVVDFRNATAVPPIPGTATFSGVPSTCKIVVPDGLYDTWIAATNWSNTSIKGMITKLSNYSE